MTVYFSLLTTLFFFLYLIPTIHSIGLVQHTFDDKITFQATIYTEYVNITLTGPQKYWFGIGFNSTEMEDTYVIVYEGDTYDSIGEYNLFYHSSGLSLISYITTINNTVTDGYRTLTLSRSTSLLSTDHFSFPTFNGNLSSEYEDISMIWAYGDKSGDIMSYHNDHRGTETVRFRNDLYTTYSPTMNPAKIPTIPPTLEPTLSPTPSPTIIYTNIWNISGSFSATDGENTISVTVGIELTSNADDDTLYLQFIGPANKWFGFGFSIDDVNVKMEDTYAFSISSQGENINFTTANVSSTSEYGDIYVERILGDVTGGELLDEPTVTIVHEFVLNNTRDIMFSRPLIITTDDGNFTTFELQQMNDPFSVCAPYVREILLAFGDSSSYDNHGKSYKTNAVWFNGSSERCTSSPTVAPTTDDASHLCFILSIVCSCIIYLVFL